MARETEWFGGRRVDDGLNAAKHERCYWRRVGFVIFLAVASALILGPLMGCATTEEEITAQVCYMRYMGKSEEGYTVVMQACQSPESFAESQR